MQWPDTFGAWLAGVILRVRIAFRRAGVAAVRSHGGFSPEASGASVEMFVFGDVIAFRVERTGSNKV